MRVPHELAEEFCELDLVVIQGANRALGPVVGEFGKEVLQVEGAGGHVEVGWLWCRI